MLRPGDPWATPATDPADITVEGNDAELAASIGAGAPDPTVYWIPSPETDLGRCVGRAAGTEPTGELVAPMDAIVGEFGLSVNAVVWGRSPASVRATSRMQPVTVVVDGRTRWSAPTFAVVVANGEFVDGVPVAPKAHPGDGLLDVVIFGIPAGERRALRTRLRHGDHLPHPRIAALRGRDIRIESGRPFPITVDGRPRGAAANLHLRCESDRWRLIL